MALEVKEGDRVKCWQYQGFGLENTDQGNGTVTKVTTNYYSEDFNLIEETRVDVLMDDDTTLVKDPRWLELI